MRTREGRVGRSKDRDLVVVVVVVVVVESPAAGLSVALRKEVINARRVRALPPLMTHSDSPNSALLDPSRKLSPANGQDDSLGVPARPRRAICTEGPARPPRGEVQYKAGE
ncbi:hypothetical protein E2C01_057556 [Portunus trituberculatus]|uniref:Uncharacterized protein n=1 Tax=Portunus trituberculatus TaxID=210409 RepID=A0A5B7H0T0_PORTR|nr:hypothetical protein [Portunus trituberculatus]